MPIRVVAFLTGSRTPPSLLTAPPSAPVVDNSELDTPHIEHSLFRAMATPGSSATSPSPPMPYRTHVPVAPQPEAGPSTEPAEQEQRKKAVQKFLARAEIAMVTRALRARLAYASYKATHNIPHVSLRDLEAQSQSQTASFNRTIAAKRKAVGGPSASGSYYNNPATQGPSAPGPGSSGLRRGGSGNMAPPASVSSPRIHTPSSSISYANYGDLASGLRNGTQAPTLYTSILAPPPSKQARTIHNPGDPPVPAPSRPTASPRVRPAKTSPKTEPSRSQAGKAKAAAKTGKAAASPRRTKGGSIDKGKRKQSHPEEVPDVDIDGDVDMKAAATLTSLLMHHKRPSIAGSTSSPRSSIDGGSEVGSAYSYAHYAQSSARTNTAAQGHSSAASTSNLASEPLINRTHTPPPPGVGGPRLQTTPRPAPTDSEAANLMLYLATSPSPARPANKDTKDMAAYRALSGGSGPLRSKGRVLFPSGSSGDLAAPPPSGPDDAGPSYRMSGSALTRGAEGSFNSSISSIGELGASPAKTQPSGTLLPSSAVSTPSMAGNSGVSQLLPPAPLPLPTAPSSPARNTTAAKDTSPTTQSKSLSAIGNGSTPTEFNFHEFLHPSPSPRNPAAAAQGHAHSTSIGSNGSGHKPNLGLRADIGRKLFEEHHATANANAQAQALQLAAAAVATTGPGGRSPSGAAGAGVGTLRQDERALGAGIDLIHSRS